MNNKKITEDDGRSLNIETGPERRINLENITSTKHYRNIGI